MTGFRRCPGSLRAPSGRAGSSLADGHPTGKAPLLGRHQELRMVEAALAEAASGSAGLLLFTGEPGIGKTRLAEESVARAQGLGWRTAWGSGWPGGGTPPLWPWQEILEQLGGSDALERLENSASELDHSPGRFTRFRIVTGALAEATSAQPVLVVLDDASDIDPGALLLARFALRSLRSSPLQLVVTSKQHPTASPETVEALHDLADEGRTVALGGLDNAAIAAFLAWAGRPDHPPDVDDLLELTGGNPLLARELVTNPGLDARAFHGRVRRLLLSRLATLDDSARMVLATGALLGPAANDEVVGVVAGVGCDRAAEVRRRGQAAGLIPRESTGFSFNHGLLRDALVDAVPSERLADLHWRAADALDQVTGALTVERLTRVAHHRVSSVDRRGRIDDDRVGKALEASRSAARAALDRAAYESAAELLRAICRVYEHHGLLPPAAALLELAQAMLAGGRLSEARVAFESVLERGGPDADPEITAEAAIGLGGIWVHEHRRADDGARFGAALRGALDGLGEGRPDLRARLAVRMAAEAVYAGKGSVREVEAAVGLVRELGDDRALAEALSLLHHTMLGPQHTHDRLQLATELIEVASTADDALLVLMGLLWRTVDLFLLGDPRADRALGEVRQRADALRVHAVLYIVAAIDVMLLLRDGRLADAEQAAGACLSLGTEVGDADAVPYYAAHMLSIAWLQGRGAELLPLAREAVAAPADGALDDVYGAVVAAFAADAGHAEEARQQLERVVTARFGDQEASSNWLVTTFAVVQAAASLNDARTASIAYDALLPYRDLPAMASIGVVCFGPTERILGLAAGVAGRLDEAVSHLERAVGAARQLGNWPILAIARADLGMTLLRRSQPGDMARATPLIEEARTALLSLGLTPRADALQAQAAVARSAPASWAELRWTPGGWELRAGSQRVLVPDGIGMRHLTRLLAAPGVDIPAGDLTGASVLSVPHEVLDDQAVESYRRRASELRADLAEAEDSADIERAGRLRLELDHLVEQVEAQLGLGGRSRRFADESERARTAVQKAVRRAIGRIRQAAPTLGDQLARSVQTGSLCRYQPVSELPVTWTITGPRP